MALSPKGKTPLADALRLAAAQVPATAETADIVLVTDGLETCGGDPCAVAAELARSGVPVRAHVVGFGLTEGEIGQIACIADATGGLVLSTQSGEELADALLRTTKAAVPPPEAPGNARLNLTIRADIAGRPDRVAFRAVGAASGQVLELGTLDFAQADALAVELGADTWLITADAGDAGNGEVEVAVVAGDTSTIYVPFRGLLPSLAMTRPTGAFRAGASGVFPLRITAEGLAVGGADFQLTLLPPAASDLNDRPITWSAQEGRLGARLGQLNLPADPGRYLVAFHRYGEEDPAKALARFEITVEPRPEVTLIAPPAVAPGAVVPVTFSGGMAHADRLEIWRDGALQSWDQSRYVEQLFDTAYGAASPLTAPAEPGEYELVYLFSDLDEASQVAARQPLRVGDNPVLDEAALSVDALPRTADAAQRCDDDTGCAMGEDAPDPGSGVVPVRILAEGADGLPVEWFAQPIGRPGELALASGAPVAGPWSTTLDAGDWALTGIAEGATFFGQVRVAATGPADFTIAGDRAGTEGSGPSDATGFVCEGDFNCTVENAEVGIILVLPPGWATDVPTREAATVGGQDGAVRMTISDPSDAADMIVLNPHQWIAANGPCVDVQAGTLCRFEPASEAGLAAFELVQRTVRDTAPRRSPAPAEALAATLGEVAGDDEAAAALVAALVGAAQGAGPDGAPDLGVLLGAVTGAATQPAPGPVLRRCPSDADCRFTQPDLGISGDLPAGWAVDVAERAPDGRIRTWFHGADPAGNAKRMGLNQPGGEGCLDTALGEVCAFTPYISTAEADLIAATLAEPQPTPVALPRPGQALEPPAFDLLRRTLTGN
jgi:Ca-activated chloride channel homolog